MKRVITIMLLVVVLVTMAAAPAEAKTKHKAKAKATVTKTVKQKATKKISTGKKFKVVTIHCPVCGDGTDNKCPYWYREDGHEQHMTDEQIEQYNFTESHYQDENGNWIEK